MQWYSPFGWGFPGWHIECSVMARAYLGDTLDLHSGGEDNIFPHHECEIAQSESLTGKPFSNHWVHTRFLQVNGQKMAKSAGNFYTVRGLVDENGRRPAGDPLGADLGPLRLAAELHGPGARGRGAEHRAVPAGGRAWPRRRWKRTRGRGFAWAGCSTGSTRRRWTRCARDLNTSVALAKGLEGARAIGREGEAMSGASAGAAVAFLDRFNALLGVVRSEYDLPAAAKEEPKVDVAASGGADRGAGGGEEGEGLGAGRRDPGRVGRGGDRADGHAAGDGLGV